MATAFTPLLDPGKYDDPSFVNKPQDIAVALSQGQKTQQQPINPVIPNALNPQSMEEKLKAEGSGTSTLSMILAIAGAAKGDFRGLQAIEESKRRTSLAKSMIPEITKVNTFVNNGEWEKASDYVNELASSYGTRADYLVPYFQQMQASIQDKQKGWNNLKALYGVLDKAVPKDHVNRPFVDALGEAKDRRDQFSETNLQGLMTRYGTPHTQITGNRASQQSLLTGEIQSQTLPEVYSSKDFDSFTGLKTAGAAGITIQGLTDLFHDKPVKREDGTVIAPNSREAQLVKAHYINQQPTEARLKIMQNLKIEPALMAQLVSQGVPVENIALGEYGKSGGEMRSALTGQSNRLAEQQISINKATTESNPYQPSTSGMVIIGKDPSDKATYLKPQHPMPHAAIQGSKGKFGEYPVAVYEKQIVPAFSGIEALDTIPALMKANPLETKGDVLKSGINQKISSILGYPVTKAVEVRQEVKARLQRAIEQAENIVINMGAASGHNDKDIADWKAYAAGNFTSTADLLKNVKTIRERLNQVLDRSGVSPIPESGGEQSPVKVLSNAITKGKSQLTRQPYTEGGAISLPENIEAEAVKRIKENIAKGDKSRTVTITQPTSVTGETPTLQQAPPSALDRAKEGMQRRQMQRMK
jgi:hypothetical protein